jgi:histidinol phosphatase-like enzyme (inositol monophosphatase family)
MSAPSPSPEELRDLLDFAVEIAWLAGQSTLAHFQSGVRAETKADRSPVTVADREAERILRTHIERQFPGDGIIGEEYGTVREEAQRRWILDPIDGTRSFVRGVPLFGVLVALEIGEDAVVGVIRFPALDETVCAARGLGCRWNGRLVRVSDVATLEDAAVLLTEAARPERISAEYGMVPAGWNELSARACLVRTWGDCYGHALVATGRAEVMIDPRMAVWDCAALRPVIEEAGGVFTDLCGAPTHRGGSAVSTNAALARTVRGLLAGGRL